MLQDLLSRFLINNFCGISFLYMYAQRAEYGVLGFNKTDY